MLPRNRHGRPAHRSSMMKRKQLRGEGVAPPAASAWAKQVDGVQEGEAGRSAVPGRIPRKPLSSSHSKEGVVSHGTSPALPTFPTTRSGPERSPSPLDEVDDPDTSFASAESQPAAPDSAVKIPAGSFADEGVAVGAAEPGQSRPSISTLGDEDTSAVETGYSTDSVSDASEDPMSQNPAVEVPASLNMSKGKGREPHGSKFSRTTLPAEILETILYLVDPETFSSLILVDSAWRKASQTPHLYAYHLSRCPSYALNNAVADAGPFTDDSLLQLKRKFAQEVKKNLFEAYLQPRRTVVNLVSTTTSSSAAFPRGEAFEFVFSPNGHWTMALSSSRIYVLDTASPKISVHRELKVLRRPTCAAILDTGTTLAVPSKDHHINIYDLSDLKTRHVRSVTLDNKPHAIAMTPKGEVLATAFDGGVELHALTSNAGEMDRRTIKCDRIDSLTFSNDGTMLLGTTRNARNPNTVVLTAPYYTDENQDLPASEQISRIWTSQIIFPTSSRDCSHAALLSSRSDGDASWTFTFDRVFESFRAVRTDDLRNGTTYFTGPKRPRRNSSSRPKRKLTPCTLPATSDCGDLVAAGFLGKDIWIYSVPDGLDVPVLSHADDPTSNSSTSTPSGNTRSPARSFTRGEAAELMRLPQWQVLVDKYRNVFAKGRRVLEIAGPTSLCWVNQARTNGAQSLKERLVVAAPGGITSGSGHEEEGFGTVDGGRLLVLDFDRSPKDGSIEELTFEVGDAVPELLEEERVDIDTEVALARRRTRKEPRPMSTVVDALASTSDDVPPLPPTANAVANLNAAIREGNSTQQSTHPSPPASPPISDSPGLTMEEASEAFDGPYSHTQPRSRTSLYRSATAVLANRQRNPPRIADGEPVRYRRADGRGELPHESDADNWVPPPPPYAPKADVPLPEHLRKSIMPRPTNSLPFPRQRGNQEQMRRSTTMLEGHRLSSLPERTSRNSHSHTSQAPMTGRSVSESLEQLTGSISPVSPRGFDFGDGNERSTPISRSSTASSRRPVSAFVGRISHSLRRSSNPRLRSADLATEDVPPVPPVPNQTASLPPSPTQDQRPVSPITLTGANLQRRLEYPLPPAPATTSTPTNTSQHDLTEASIPALPTTAQLSHLNDRYNTPPPKPSTTRLPHGLTTSGDRIPAPPRGAMGAAGGTNSPRNNNSRAASPINPATMATATGDHSGGSSLTPTRNLSGRTSLAARSSPALLRPQAHRLDTIESISSIVSARTKTRSRTRSGGRELRSAGGGMERTQSSGPALRLDRITAPAAGEGKKGGFFGRGKRKEGKGKGRDAGADAWNGAHPGEGEGEGGGGERGAYAEDRARRMESSGVDGKGEKGGKCAIM